MALLLIRHGETALNVARTYQPADTPLSVRGIAQADALARRLACMGVGAILSSDLPRALRTAQVISAMTGLPIETTGLLHERNFGDLRGRSHDSLGYNAMFDEAAPPNGESGPVFRQRVGQAFELVLERHTRLGGSGHLAVVTHGLVIHALLAGPVGLTAERGLPTRIANTSLSIIGAEPPYGLELLDCSTHLEGATLDDQRSLSGG